ncbi:peroxiredoxin [Arthrobacter stackebrandtii]|uniref:peroxiredoxin n=1 Tax=Arthrobacter stackebrandtii TaxID=272161 RepID=UPI000D8A5F03|nr:peroxiredoxin [Arthrobacter stackebrandtii]PYG99320.1 peroxiredoxin [Arthrobacter stackebrandtii]
MDDGGTRQGLVPGDIAPDFSLPNQFGEPVSLSGLLGGSRPPRGVALVFYPFAFSGICTGELCELRDNIADFAAAGVTLLAVSVDTKFTLRAYARAEGYDFDLLADFWPHGEVAQAYCVFDPVNGMAGRSTFLIGADGRIADSFSTPRGQARPLGRYRQALERL